MSGLGEHDEGEARLSELYLGFVVDNEDPELLGRVRVELPGLIEPASAWALPIGSAHGGGAAQRGSYDVPDKGAAVAVLFHSGDADHPYYLGGWFGRGETPSPLAGLSAKDAVQIKCYESSRFLIVLDHRSGNEALLVKDKQTGDLISVSPAETRLRSAARVVVEAPEIHLGAASLVPTTAGVVVAAGIDPFTGATYGVLGNASAVVRAKK